MPSDARTSAGIEACVMIAGCSIRLSTPPRLSASANSSQRSRKRFVPARSLLVRIDSIPPNPRGYAVTLGLAAAATPETLVALAAPRPVVLIGTDTSAWAFAPAVHALAGSPETFRIDTDVVTATTWLVQTYPGPSRL